MTIVKLCLASERLPCQSVSNQLPTYLSMKANPEIFKGIEYVRISSLPKDQQSILWTTFDRTKVIKVLKEKSLLNDCIQYADYVQWYIREYSREIGPVRQEALSPDLGAISMAS
ncbi:MAG: hypothetical protein K1X47_00760 [Cyclobacteriaceae bacterium]|nr:hypothetical protein [Cyclobacteriaceae bacterium]